MKEIWEKLLNIGLSENLPFSEKKKIRIGNGIALIMLSIAVLRAFDAAYLYDLPRLSFNLIMLCTSVFILLLNQYKFYLFIRYFIVIWITLLVTYFVLQHKLIHYFNYLIAPLVFVFINFDDKKIIFGLSAFVCFIYLGLNYWFFTHPELLAAAIHNFNMVPLLVSVILICFVLWYFKAEHINYQKEIEAKNAVLQEQKEEIEETAEQLKELNTTKDKLFSIISHDLRNPINRLKSIFQLLDNQLLSQEEFLKISRELKSGVDNTHLLLDNLLLWAYNQMQGIQTIPQYFCIKELINEKVNLLKESAESKKINLSNQINKKITVFADENQIALVLRNLISNAIKFTPENGSICIQGSKEKERAVISIRDTGIGIPPEDLAKLFTKNDYLSRSGTLGEAGTGLGLQLVKEMLENNDGIICIESEVGQGSKFSFDLPLNPK